MCLIAFAIDPAPGCRLLLAANRDEDHGRPTAPLHRWPLDNGAEVIAGRDLRDGGTWLGVGLQGRVALLTNVRQAQAARAPRSRGELVARWLAGDASLADLQRQIDPQAYGGFNLVVGDATRGHWTWLSNRDPLDPHSPQTPRLHTRTIGAGRHTLSNASLDTPWPKAQRLAAALDTAIERLEADTDWQAPLTHALADTREAEAHALPGTGVPPALEQALSSPFVHLPQRGYGTRSSTVLHWHADGRLQIDEWTHDPAAPETRFDPATRRSAQLRWP